MGKHATDAIFIERLDLGPANGPTVAVKDCLDIAGTVTRAGSAAFDDAQPASAHAHVVDQLLAAGCHIVGKTNMHEFAYGMTGVNAHFGTPINPKWPDIIPGGSSSGSAVAVAAGLVDFAIGTDTGGSVRQPAICCGVVGFKPTYGRIDRRGASPAQSSLDCIGPFGRDVAVIERAMTAIDADFKSIQLDHAPRLARLRSTLDASVGDALNAVFLEHDFAPTYIDLPSIDDAFRAGMVVIARETYAAFGHLLSRAELLGADVRTRLEAAAKVTDDELAWAEDVRKRFTAEVDAVLTEFDALLTPALPIIPPTLTAAKDPATVLPLTRYLRPFNLSGHPAIVLPAVNADNLPIGYQLVGRKRDDANLCAIARWFGEMI